MIPTKTLQEWEQLAEKATTGPWRCKDAPHAPYDGQFRVLGQDFDPPPGVTWQKDNRPTPAYCAKYENARFIAASRTVVPALCAEVRRLQAVNARMRQLITDAIPFVERAADSGYMLVRPEAEAWMARAALAESDK